MKQTFDFRRFWQTLKWTVLTEKKSILTAFVAFTVAFLAIQLFSCFTIFDLKRGLGSEATYVGMAVCSLLIGFMGAYYASGVLGNARNSRQRVTALMLPASNLEKFAARLVYCCIVMLLLLYVAVFAATCLRMLLELIAGHDDITAGLSVFSAGDLKIMDMDDDGLGRSTFLYLAVSWWSTSIFVLGGLFFRTRPFVWTNVTMFVGSLVLFTLLFYIGILIGEDRIKNFFMNFKDMTFDTFRLIVSLILTAFTVFNVWLSYWLYKRLEVVQHKWFNV